MVIIRTARAGRVPHGSDESRNGCSRLAVAAGNVGLKNRFETLREVNRMSIFYVFGKMIGIFR